MTNELRSEYAFDYRQAKPNRFAATQTDETPLTVEPDNEAEPEAKPGSGLED